MSKITLVTGLWDIKRDSLGEGWNRSFDEHYITKFKQLLDVPCNLIVFGEEHLEKVVFEKRDRKNTQFLIRNQEWFKNEFYDKIQKIRTSEEWYSQSGWLPDSTQAKLEMYNPLVMSKMFLLNDARILDNFNSEYLFWIDAGLTNTVHPGYFTHDKVFDKLHQYISKFTFVCFPYLAEKEIHGFTYPDINEYANADVKLVARGGFFGGPKDSIAPISGEYYTLLSETLHQGYMGTEESVFSILNYKYHEHINYFEIESNGLFGKFFEDLKNGKLVPKNTNKFSKVLPVLDYKKVGVYVLTYNSPKQFKILCESFEKYDPNFLKLPKKYLLNNSIDRSTDDEYDKLCKQYNFEQIKKDNIGICGGRQFIAEHFDETDLEYYHFFEDDMAFWIGENDICHNGFNRKIKDFYKKSLHIAYLENFDFLKLNFTEFFGDNIKQWSWHNVPADKRREYFPEKPVKKGKTSNIPFTNFKNIKSYKSLPYTSGEIYYCNWPQIVSREGNKKMFLDTKWEYPYEQTWMSHFYTLVKEGKLNPGLLLATPTYHERFDHYKKEERREN